MVNPDALHLLALAEAEGLGYWVARLLYECYDGLDEVWTSPVRKLTACLRRAKVRHPARAARGLLDQRACLMAAAARRMEDLERQGVALMWPSDEAFPRHLCDIPHPPYWLFVQGDTALLSQTGVACVGTRQPSPAGVQMAEWVAAALTCAGATVVSGLAQGIDTAAHVQALDRRGRTVAVLGHGIDTAPPKSAAKLRDRILAERGAIVTEYPPAERLDSRNFMWRNRLQSGLSVCTVPVEWAPGSGTAHTVEFSFKQRHRVVGLTHESWDTATHPELRALAKRGAVILELPSDRDKIGEACLRGARSGSPGGTQLGLFREPTDAGSDA